MPMPSFCQYLYTDRVNGICTDLGLLIARVGFGGMMITHGWGKLLQFSQMAQKFPDPLGVGPQASLCLAIFAEFFCSILVVAGLLTRLAAIPQITTMAVAAIIIHRNDPFLKKEMALLYLTAWVLILLTGPGRFSLDHLIGRGLRKP